MTSCEGFTKAGKPCSRKAIQGTSFCKKHTKIEYNSIGVNTEQLEYHDVVQANKIILELIDDLAEKNALISELTHTYNKLDQLTSFS